jgi:hypothetical protein
MYINLICPPDHNQIIPHGFIIKCLISALEDLGHSVYFNWMSPVYARPAFSIVMGPLLLVKFHKEYTRALIKNRPPFILHSTEMLREDISGFNWFDRDTFTQEERDLFVGLVNASLMVWTSNADIEIYNRIKNNAHTPKIGGTPSLPTVRRQSNPPIDILFFGSLDDRRRKILESLKATGLNVVVLGYTDDIVRDQFVSATKAVISIHHNPSITNFKVRSVYSHRLVYLAHHGVTSISDYAQARSGDWELLFEPVPDGNYAQVAENIILSGSWQDAGLRAREFLNTVRYADQIGPLIVSAMS